MKCLMGRSVSAGLCVCMTMLVLVMVSLQLGCTVTVGYGYENRPKPKLTDRVKMLWRQASTYLFPPNIDFRRSVSSSSASVSEEKEDQRMSGREKVKEAVAKSVEKGKTTVEESAKAAAHTAQDLLKNTFSAYHQQPPEL